MKPRQRRLLVAVIGLCSVSAAIALTLSAFNDNIVFFFSPSQIVSGEAPVARSLRVGGLVEEDSLTRDPDGVTARFTITDTVSRIRVVYTGILPDLFKEGRGCVAQGTVGADGTLRADQVLAKHDENYMPIEAARSIEDATRAARKAGGTVQRQEPR